mgnify:FL=1
MFSRKPKITVTSYYCKKCGISKFVRSIDENFDGKCKVCGRPMEVGDTRIYNDSKKLPSHLKGNYYDSELKYKDTVAKFNNQEQPQQQTSKPIVTCPYCGSANCKKISAGHRWLSTGLFGLASSDIGKQWKCDNCKSKF